MAAPGGGGGAGERRAPAGGGGTAVRLALPLLLALVAAVYLRTGGHRFVHFDDPDYLRPPVVRAGITAEGIRWAFETFHASNWHPLAWISHMADMSLFGPAAPGAHHLESAFLHGVNAWLFFLLLFRSTGLAGRSLFAASLFAVHPVHVESVAWAAERKDLLCALFFLLALHAWARHGRSPSPGRYLAAAALFALALLSKPMAVTLPFVLLLLDAWPLGRTRYVPPADGSPWNPAPLSRLLREKVPLFLLSAASCAVTLAAQRSGQAIKGLDFLPARERAANALASYASYVGKLFWPSDLAVLYPLPPSPGIPAWKAAAALASLLAATAVLLRKGRSRPYLPVGWLWFLGMLVPVIGIVQAGEQALADRYAYLPFLGAYAALSWGAADLAPSLPRREILPAAAAAAVALLGSAAFVQAGYWKDSETLFRHALAVTEGNHIVRNNLGIHYAEQGREGEALLEFAEAVRIRPGDAFYRTNLARSLVIAGRPAEALPHFEAACRLAPGDRECAARLEEARKIAGNPGGGAVTSPHAPPGTLPPPPRPPRPSRGRGALPGGARRPGRARGG